MSMNPPPEVPLAGRKYTKKEADYGDKSSSPAEHRCGICEFIQHIKPHPHTCRIVEGTVQDLGGCKFFRVDLIKAANDHLNLLDNPAKK